VIVGHAWGGGPAVEALMSIAGETAETPGPRDNN